MLKVYGVTFDHTVNYGSSLQAYALQTAIENTVIGGEQCSYRLIPLLDMPEHTNYRYGIRRQNLLKRMLGEVFFTINFRQFRSFEGRYMKYADCHHFQDLPRLNQEADAFVCGSDVIWNSFQNKGLDEYYLNFANRYKFSYAASFGSDDADKGVTEKQKEYLSELKMISCREKSSAIMAKRLTGRKAEIVVDPVLLIGADQWKKIIPGKVKPEKYIFSYTTHLFPEYEKFLQQLSKETGLRIVRAVYAGRPSIAIKQRKLVLQTPQQWLQQLYNAEYVVTNSFHATAFSVMFHKKFFTVVHGDGTKGINIRMNDFLSGLGLQDRLYSAAPDQMNLTETDYTPIDSRLDQLRTDSIAFLRRNLEAAYEGKQQSEQKGSEK